MVHSISTFRTPCAIVLSNTTEYSRFVLALRYLAINESMPENSLTSYMDDIEKYQSQLGENAIKIIIERWFALTLRKVPERKGVRTPDYEIFDAKGELIAICEVKSCVDANVPTYDPGQSYEELSEISRKKDRNHRSKVEAHHRKAISQIANHRNLPTLMAFMSFDMTDYIDLANVLEDSLTVFPDDPLADLYLLIKVHQDVVPSDVFTITTTPQLLYSNERGELFGHQYLSLEEALRNGGLLPATFRNQEQGI